MEKRTYNAGVLFCGGCNSRYDRLAFYQDLRARCVQRNITFDYYGPDRGENCDFIVLINGCGSECLLEKNYPCPVVLLKSGDPEEALRRVDACLAALPL